MKETATAMAMTWCALILSIFIWLFREISENITIAFINTQIDTDVDHFKFSVQLVYDVLPSPAHLSTWGRGGPPQAGNSKYRLHFWHQYQQAPKLQRARHYFHPIRSRSPRPYINEGESSWHHKGHNPILYVN